MKLVFVSGCFDLLHSGHLELLTFARRQGDRLVVSVASDATIRHLKREPIVPEADRLELIRALRCVDEAFLCRGEPGNLDCFSYVRNLRPAVWVVNHDEPELSAKATLAAELGCELVLNHRPEQGLSTSALIPRLLGRGTRMERDFAPRTGAEATSERHAQWRAALESLRRRRTGWS